MNNIDDINIPIIFCLDREDCIGLKFYCDYCKCWHYHGKKEGHRFAHCISDNSPYLLNGYILKRGKEKK